ncbi:hypothetical protein IEI94_13795 [Halomonas sp. ML-15]|uniref:hypothetical protein n=1 Tax=Halomonas sp. ML-15 TaxID=2773305 RepID=UPI00174742CA|nr:hypothetical protein [Halomonas sp. ML-15]MBD3896925.1 hypothetical protein [Halomonas sp. ML-15]
MKEEDCDGEFCGVFGAVFREEPLAQPTSVTREGSAVDYFAICTGRCDVLKFLVGAASMSFLMGMIAMLVFVLRGL